MDRFTSNYQFILNSFSRTAIPNNTQTSGEKREIIVGPLRVLPGRLSVSRTFGDIEAKLTSLGGNPQVVVAIPEITSFKINLTDHDFLVLGCDGIFDKMSNDDIVNCVWNSVADNKQLKVATNVHKQSGMAVEYILKNSLLRRTLDNVTVVMISFSNFKRAVFGESKQSARLEEPPVHIEEKKRNSTFDRKSTGGSGAPTGLGAPLSKENIPPPTSNLKTFDNSKQSGGLPL